MNRLFMTAIMLLALSCVAAAADVDYPKFEVFGGYSLMHVGELGAEDLGPLVQSTIADYGGTLTGSSSTPLVKKGVASSITYNLTESLGIEGAFRFNTGDIAAATGVVGGDNIGAKAKLTHIAAMGGPRFTWRKNERIAPFAHALVGWDREKPSGSIAYQGETLTVDPGSANGLGVMLGGGVDVNVNRLVAVRLIQADYYLTRHGAANTNNLALAFGVVFRF